VKLIEALQLLRRPLPDEGPRLRVTLACGFTPLHLETFLAATLRRDAPATRVEVGTGLFDDLAGTVERAAAADADAVAVVVEWADVDPRLGIRSLGGWGPEEVADVLAFAAERVARLEAALRALAATTTVVCCLPTLPLPPAFAQHPLESGGPELQLRRLLAGLAEALAAEPRIRVASAQALDARSPLAERLDVKGALASGFPYTLPHAAAVAEALAFLIRDPAPKKGLITDLDDTVWAGLLGEVGVDGVRFSLDQGAQDHGLYQQMLASLAASGVLVAVASKNEPDLVDEAFAREDLVLRRDAVFPFEVSWGPKSAAVARILDTWNIGPDAVVFVDDSPLELAEVAAAFPEIECVRFPSGDPNELWGFLGRLRELFGKRTVTAEDSLRLASIRSASELRRSVAAAGDSNGFLESVDGEVALTCDSAPDARALELINKTNQFNLNGRRLSEAEFHTRLEDPSAFLLTAGYRDRFGPLGKIAAVLGRRDGDTVAIDSWVMSCRAFSRRIEHHTLAYLFEALGAEAIVLDYEATPRNGVLREFLDSLGPDAGARITRDGFEAAAPALVHRVTTAEGARG
jgi:FkbH-like protein